MPDESIETLRQAATAKFDKICDFLADLHGLSSNPENLSNKQNDQIVGEAEELIEKSDPLGQHTIKGLPDELERLLAEYHDINGRRWALFKAAREHLTERGVLIDSSEKKMNPRTGEWEIVWKLNPNLTEEQQQALAEQPDAKDRH
jgi:hypothetical protein